jgi:hypothetical protein
MTNVTTRMTQLLLKIRRFSSGILRSKSERKYPVDLIMIMHYLQIEMANLLNRIR